MLILDSCELGLIFLQVLLGGELLRLTLLGEMLNTQ